MSVYCLMFRFLVAALEDSNDDNTGTVFYSLCEGRYTFFFHFFYFIVNAILYADKSCQHIVLFSSLHQLLSPLVVPPFSPLP